MESEGENTDGTIEGEVANAPTPTSPIRPSSRLSVISRRSRRNSVQMACERCRRRKIKCSGLPGPCSACASLGTVCHDPGKRKDRTHSLLENRIQRLEALALQGRAASHSEGMMSIPHRPASHSPTPFIAQPEPRHALHIQTQNLANFSLGNDFNQQSFAFGWDNFPAPTSPACYSDIGPDIGPWTAVDYQQTSPDMSTPNPSIPRRSHTFPTVPTDEFCWNQEEVPPLSAGAFSDIPSIEVTSPGCSPPQSPFAPPEQLSPRGFSIPYRSSLIDVNDEPNEPALELPRTPPLFAVNSRTQDEQIDYYGDFLSPIDQPPSLSRRSSNASSNDFSEPSPGFRTRLGRSQTLPSSLAPDRSVNIEQLNITLGSPRTRNYLQIYFKNVHPEFPILDPAAFVTKNPSSSIILTYQTLLAAAIGALTHHQSRSLSSPYVRLAMSLQPQIDMWSSISGVHCAILLAIYCFFEETTSFSDEVDQNDLEKLHITEALHPAVNLWLHNCQIATTCVDLGLNLGFLSGISPISIPPAENPDLSFFAQTTLEMEMQMMFRNTFRVAHKLDKRISNLKQRPRAIRDRELDPGLIAEYMLDARDA